MNSPLVVRLTNVFYRSRRDSTQRIEHLVNKWKKIRNAVGTSTDDDHIEWNTREVMLVFELAVHGQECVDLPARTYQQSAVFHTRPTETLHGYDFVTDERSDKVVREVFVKQNAHWSARSHARARVRR